MAHYGDGPTGGQGDYGGTYTNEPLLEEMISALMGFFGLRGGEHIVSYKPWVPGWLQRIAPNRQPTAAQIAAFTKASADLALGGFIVALCATGWGL